MGEVAKLAHEIDGLLLIGRYVVQRRHDHHEDTKHLTHLEVLVLRVLEALTERISGVTVGALRGLPGRHEASISRVLTGLETEGHIRREHRPGTGRHLFLDLTDKGRQTAEQLRTNDENHLRAFLRHLQPETIADALKVVRAVNKMISTQLQQQLELDSDQPEV